MAKKELNPMEKMMAMAFTRQRSGIFTQLGALILLVTSFNPYFWPHQVTGLIILGLSITLDVWRSANKKQRRIILWTMLVVNEIIFVNFLGRFLMPSVITPEMAYRVGNIITFGVLAHIIMLFGIGQGLLSLRFMD